MASTCGSARTNPHFYPQRIFEIEESAVKSGSSVDSHIKHLKFRVEVDLVAPAEVPDVVARVTHLQHADTEPKEVGHASHD
jgi:hypothetical protein